VAANTSLIKFVNSPGSFHLALSLFNILVLCLAVRIHVAGALNQKALIIASVLLTLFACALLGLIHYSPSCPLQLTCLEPVYEYVVL